MIMVKASTNLQIIACQSVDQKLVVVVLHGLFMYFRIITCLSQSGVLFSFPLFWLLLHALTLGGPIVGLLICCYSFST